MKPIIIKDKINQHLISANDKNDGVFMTAQSIKQYFKVCESEEFYKKVSQRSDKSIARCLNDLGFKSVVYRPPFNKMPIRGYFIRFKTPTQYKRELYKNHPIKFN
ncbi:hypothetical protein [Emticicia sp. W12TSBA100-4]|uniref:hypothetical protein n=1 Tax=Emticicia sp. W12TSBA100-4 TaxID=3160965 RepID=UPI0033063043